MKILLKRAAILGAIGMLGTAGMLTFGEGRVGHAADRTSTTESAAGSPHDAQPAMPKGAIGVSLHVGANRVGDPAALYIAYVHPEGPAHQAGLSHGDEVITIDGQAVTGKTYEQVVGMVRGEIGTVVKLGVKGERGSRDVSVTRVASDTLYKNKMGSHEKPAR